MQRLILGAIVAGLLAWAALDSTVSERRSERLNESIARNELPALTPAERDTFSRVVKWLAASAGVGGQVRINEHYSMSARKSGALHVYVTRATQAAVTGCESYNALYDPELDAIFIDESFVTLADWKSYLAQPDGGWGLDIRLSTRDLPSLNVLLRFIVLHELGHRQLSLSTNRTAASPEGEAEADRFAIRAMRAAFASAARFDIDAVEPYTGDLVEFPISADMPIEDQVQIALVEMSKLVLSAQLVLPSAVSPFRKTRTHPDLISRVASLMRAADETYKGSASSARHHAL